MILPRFFSRTVVFVFCMLLGATAARAQFKASVQGTVQDAKGGAVSGAKVTITNQDTGISRSTVASGEGFYRLSELPPGKYTIVVESSGFKQSTVKDDVVEAEQLIGRLDELAAVVLAKEPIAERAPLLR